ncbi:YhcN/YlaJ family sporulation lipoprotein [Bacillus sp. HMF5848]|uniref:YhcN/YlaJ family sporulation lipoprotein n=1 Tax=Bacillus sp. HMF5848 TaxID=2495421 RepID=UPI000F7AB346|nr:YhcN/YlaJ family sporulation lipoprotein [Bacillus sp. HMF5848]RSK26890.1 YhcN/YlaJ family sporulation lipoprotein [Bacillus sp. HMF5848]
MNRLSILVTVIFLIMLSACANAEKESAFEENPNAKTIHVKNSITNKEETYSGQDIAKHLVELATSVPTVKDATAVVVGNYAVVGIDVDADLDRSRVSTIKYTVAEALKKDPHGSNAVIVADPDVTERLREMGKEIESGQPIVGILDELAAIVGRVVPELPSEVLDNDNVTPTEENEQQLNSNEQQKLDNEQKDQATPNQKP